MKRVIISIILLLSFFCGLNAQHLITWYQHNVSPGTTSYIVRGYKAEFHSVYKNAMWIKGHALNIFEHPNGFEFDYQAFFNRNGLITSKRYYTDGKLSEDIGEYTYNKRNQLVKFSLYHPEDTHQLLHKYVYNDNGKMVHHSYGCGIILGDVVSFHNGWRNIESGVYDRTNAHSQVTHYVKETSIPDNNFKYTNEYSDAGLLMKHTWEKDIYSKTAKGKIWKRTVSERQFQSKVDLWNTSMFDSQVILRYAYTYKKVYTLEYTEYNKMGDWTKAKVFLDDVPFMFLEREITYSADAKKPIEIFSFNDFYKRKP